MAKEWILNQANMRWGLTRKSKVGPVAELIRKCAPKTLNDWEKFYLDKAYSKQHLEQLGKTLFIKVTDVCKAEIEDVTEEDCINFIYNLVINRTFDGYQSEIQTIYGQLEKILGVKIESAPDEWDRGYNVQFLPHEARQSVGVSFKIGSSFVQQLLPPIFCLYCLILMSN